MVRSAQVRIQNTPFFKNLGQDIARTLLFNYKIYTYVERERGGEREIFHTIRKLKFKV